MIKDFFKGIVSSRSCGRNADDKTYVFGIFEHDPFSDGKHPLSNDEACAIINTAYDKGNGIAKVASSESAIEDIRKTGKHIILLNHSYADALMFNENMSSSKSKEESALIALAKLKDGKRRLPDITKRDRDFISQRSQSKDFNDLEMHFTVDNIINLSRLARFTNAGEIGDKMDDYAVNNGISADDLATLVFHHELGHQCVKTPYTYRSPKKITTGEECADAYAAIWHLARTGNTKAVEYLADFRNMNTVQAAVRGRYSDIALTHYTTEVLDFILDEYKKDPERFRKAAGSCEDIKKMASEIVEEHGISLSRYNELAKDIDTHNIVKSDLGKRATETLKKLEVITDDASKEDVIKAFMELAKTPKSGHVSLKNKIAIKKELTQKITALTESEVLKGTDYKRAFLTAYVNLTSDTVPGYGDCAKSRYSYNILHKMLVNDTKTEKRIKTPINLLRRIAAETSDRLPEGDLIENYCRIKTDYAEKIKQIATEIRCGEISEKTMTYFKEAVGLAKTARNIAITATEKNLLPTDNKQLVKIMEKDVKNEFPAELVKIVSAKNPSLHQIKKLKQITM